jgi:hypothetical protein
MKPRLLPDPLSHEAVQMAMHNRKSENTFVLAGTHAKSRSRSSTVASQVSSKGEISHHSSPKGASNPTRPTLAWVGYMTVLGWSECYFRG